MSMHPQNFSWQKGEENNKDMFTCKDIMIFENNIGVQQVFFLAPKIMNNLFHQMVFWRVCVYNFLTKWNTLVRF